VNRTPAASASTISWTTTAIATSVFGDTVSRPVGDRTVGKEARHALTNAVEHRIRLDAEIRVVLAGERRCWEVFGGRRGPNRVGGVGGEFERLGDRFRDSLIELPFPDERAERLRGRREFLGVP
jgi:hypothetical protein